MPDRLQRPRAVSAAIAGCRITLRARPMSRADADPFWKSASWTHYEQFRNAYFNGYPALACKWCLSSLFFDCPPQVHSKPLPPLATPLSLLEQGVCLPLCPPLLPSTRFEYVPRDYAELDMHGIACTTQTATNRLASILFLGMALLDALRLCHAPCRKMTKLTWKTRAGLSSQPTFFRSSLSTRASLRQNGCLLSPTDQAPDLDPAMYMARPFRCV